MGKGKNVTNEGIFQEIFRAKTGGCGNFRVFLAFAKVCTREISKWAHSRKFIANQISIGHTGSDTVVKSQIRHQKPPRTEWIVNAMQKKRKSRSDDRRLWIEKLELPERMEDKRC